MSLDSGRFTFGDTDIPEDKKRTVAHLIVDKCDEDEVLDMLAMLGLTEDLPTPPRGFRACSTCFDVYHVEQFRPGRLQCHPCLNRVARRRKAAKHAGVYVRPAPKLPPPGSQAKTCSKCGVTKAPEAFRTRRETGRLRGQCRTCEQHLRNGR